MSDFIYADMTAAKRKKALEAQAASIHEEEYGKKISDQELAEQKDQYTKDAMKLQQLEAELKKIADAHKAGIKSHEALMSERLELVKTGRRATKGLLYGLPNRDKQTVDYYDESGELIYSAPMTAKDQQGGLFLDGAQEEYETQDVDFEEVTTEEVNDLYSETGEATETEAPEEKPKKNRGKKS